MKEEKTGTLKFVVFSLLGILLFFVPVWKGQIPVIVLINGVKAAFGSRLGWISSISCLLLATEVIGGTVFGIPRLKKAVEGEKIRLIFWLLSAGIVILNLADAPLFFITHPKIGGEVLKLGSAVFITIAVAGSLVILIIRSGLVEFIALLMEPVMEPVFRLPGEAAVNILSSFISSASIGVYFTDQYYKNRCYTTRQACSVVTSFSVISVGYIGVIASLAGIGELYGALLIASFLTVLLMGAVMIRIPPLCLIPDRYIDGSRPEKRAERLGASVRFRKALEAGSQCASGFCLEDFRKNVLQSLGFAQKIVGVMIPTVTLVLTLVYGTPVFSWLGRPLVPVLKAAGVPEAAAAAPSVLIGIVEVTLPSILIGGTEAAAQTRFFVALLSIVQIIFFSEAGNAILASDIPLGPGKLIGIFLMRTAVAIPIVALAARLVCGG